MRNKPMRTTRKKDLKILKFKNEDEEREFWATHDSSDYFDWGKAEPAIFEKLKPSVHSISLRLPDALLEKLKVLANKKDVPYQTLLKIYLSDRVEKEFKTI
jgi:predicted DNA binding CopG/RHH family protein